jgi:hypothetical protein
MIRSDSELHKIPVHEWTEEEGFEHLRKTFDLACNEFPDVMEPYVIRFPEWEDRDGLKAFMRAALRETFQHRRPSRAPAKEPAE